MINVSDEFKTAMKEPIKEIQASILIGDQIISSSEDLVSFKVSSSGGILKTAMKKLEGKLIGEYRLIGEIIRTNFSVKTASGNYEPLDFGSFKVTEVNYIKDTNETTFVAYDFMINTMKKYEILEIDYPINLYEYTKKLCEQIGLSLKNTSFKVNNNFLVSKELWKNIDGITYRDILTQIAQATASICIINNDQIEFKEIKTTNETITYDNLFKFTLKPKYGEINSVVLSRQPIVGEDVFLKDDNSINENGLTELNIANNQIVDKDRETAITGIYNELKGKYFYPFEIETEGLGWYEIGDILDIQNNNNEKFQIIVLDYEISIDGGIKETLKAEAETKIQSQYQYASNISKRLKNTEIIVNKQEQNIQSLVLDMYDKNGKVAENYTKVQQSIDSIINSIQNTTGSNLIKNSVMFGYNNDRIPTEWEVSKNGRIEMYSDPESFKKGGISGHCFKLLNKQVKQKIIVQADEEDVSENKKLYYSFSCKIKKSAAGTAIIKVYNDNEEYIKEFGNGDTADYLEVVFEQLLPKSNYYIVELYGSEDSEAIFTDLILSPGKYKSQWQQANGEVMNTQVNINIDGIIVKSSLYQGDYTIMSPLEFAGYANINGTITKIFTLNKDKTEIYKLLAQKEIAMPPLKIIGISEGKKAGWHFVKI